MLWSGQQYVGGFGGRCRSYPRYGDIQLRVESLAIDSFFVIKLH